MSPAFGCQDVARLALPLLDGELGPEDRDLALCHLDTCTPCRDTLAAEVACRREVRAGLSRPTAPPGLRRRVLKTLDDFDAVAIAPQRRRSRLLVGVAAATFLVAASAGFLIREGRATPAEVVGDAIRVHERNLPIEVQGAEDEVQAWMVGKVPVPVRPPRLRHPSASFVGARLSHLRDRDAAQLIYRIGPSQMTVHVFDAAGIAPPATRRRSVGQREIWSASERGYHVVFVRERGVGYAFTSDLGEDDLVRLVSTSLD